MFNKQLILTLLNIDSINRNAILKLLNYNLPYTLSADDIFTFINNRAHIKSTYPITIEDILIAKRKMINIIDFCNKNQIKIITILDDLFPIKLKIIKNPPVILFYKGNFNCITNNNSIAIIGTRSPSKTSKNNSYKLGYLLGKNNFTVISGLAKGCDKSAHMGCINSGGNTLAILPCGVDIVYPTSNKSLACDIINNNGCIVSEYFPTQKPLKYHFIERDRIQSALSLGIIVVECSLNSGTMHTVKFALEQNKIIGCCYSNNSSNSSGNEFLLKNYNSIKINNNSSLKYFCSLFNKNNLHTNSDKFTSSCQLSFDL